METVDLPVCEGGPQTVTVAEGEDVRLTCRVDAKPEDDLRFTWYFNNTLDTVEVERHRIQVRKGFSFLDYTPRCYTPQVHCPIPSAQVSIMSRPVVASLSSCPMPSPPQCRPKCCLSLIYLHHYLECPLAICIIGIWIILCRPPKVQGNKGPPERVEDCELVNHTGGTLEVVCSPGGDGGLPQWFVGRVYDASTHTLLDTLEESHPRFQVAEKRMGEVSSGGVSPLVGVFLGLVGGFVGLLLLGVSLTLLRTYRCLQLGESRGGEGVVGDVVGPSSPTTKTGPTTPTHHSQADPRAGPDVLISANSDRVSASSSTPRVRVVSSYCDDPDDDDTTQSRALTALWPSRMSSSV
ncbi:putative Immunoglobulin domain-containing protein 2 [Homarus americanus]|uniref:Putative Immunoglobulin domain-containing protein 2 n=1 Tax=Homarus americanus TaxID=6706 RepID=A0A8J5NBT3_HOMAM|nr:putative Immunoglobulin domain-containing protein 2 [Homarus americanus]